MVFILMNTKGSKVFRSIQEVNTDLQKHEYFDEYIHFLLSSCPPPPPPPAQRAARRATQRRAEATRRATQRRAWSRAERRQQCAQRGGTTRGQRARREGGGARRPQRVSAAVGPQGDLLCEDPTPHGAESAPPPGCSPSAQSNAPFPPRRSSKASLSHTPPACIHTHAPHNHTYTAPPRA